MYSSGVLATDDWPVGRVPAPGRLEIATLKLSGDRWSMGRRSGRVEELESALGELDTFHELRIDGATDALDSVARPITRAVRRGTFVTQVPGEIRDKLSPHLAAVTPDRVEGIPGELTWDVASVVQRRAALRDVITDLPTVSLVLVTRRADLVGPMVKRISEFNYPNLEIVVGCHGVPVPADLDAGDRAIVSAEFSADTVFGDVVDQAFKMASGELVGKIDDDDYYSDDHLWDLVAAHKYSGAELVGKSTTVVYIESLDTTVRRVYGARESFTNRVAGGTMLLRQSDLQELGGWPHVPRAVDTALINRVIDAGAAIYQPHDIGYLYMRYANADHTWSPSEAHFLRNTPEQWIGLLRNAEFGT